MHFILLKGSPRLLSNRCKFVSLIFKHAYYYIYIYIQRISIVPYIIRILSDFIEEKSTRRNKRKMIPDTPYMSRTYIRYVTIRDRNMNVAQIPHVYSRQLTHWSSFVRYPIAKFRFWLKGNFDLRLSRKRNLRLRDRGKREASRSISQKRIA